MMRILLLLLCMSMHVSAQQKITLARDANGVVFRMGKKNILYYRSSVAMPPADSPSYYQRSGFIHPVYTPSGKIVTDDFPSNHAHQHALFYAWPNTRFRGEHVDFWNQHKQEGTVKHGGIVSMKEGKGVARLVTKQEYISIKHGKVLDESWTITCYGTASKGFLFNIDVDQVNVTSDTLFLDQYLYGGMAFRGSATWDPFNKARFSQRWNVQTSEGRSDSAANHTSANWVTVTGKIDGQESTVTVFSHPSNYRHPQKIRVHPEMPYWAFSPVVDGPFFIAPRSHYRARYRYWVNDAAPSKEELTGMYRRFADSELRIAD